jgi:hypothetical protein
MLVVSREHLDVRTIFGTRRHLHPNQSSQLRLAPSITANDPSLPPKSAQDISPVFCSISVTVSVEHDFFGREQRSEASSQLHMRGQPNKRSGYETLATVYLLTRYPVHEVKNGVLCMIVVRAKSTWLWIMAHKLQGHGAWSIRRATNSVGDLHTRYEYQRQANFFNFFGSIAWFLASIGAAEE